MTPKEQKLFDAFIAGFRTGRTYWFWGDDDPLLKKLARQYVNSRVKTRLKMKCKAHPNYQAKRAPRVKNCECIKIWNAKLKGKLK